MKIKYITNQDINSISGGWSGINYNIFLQLYKYFEITYVGPIAPPSFLIEKFFSKIPRMIGLKGNFHFFSENRLNEIQNIVSPFLIDSEYNFFFGQTPWIKISNSAPYGVYMDADFLTYLNIYLSIKQFARKDICRIMKLEEKWLQSAKHIFIGSEWAWEEMSRHYDLNMEQKIVVHTGGNVPISEKDYYERKLNFIFISLNFEKKGGFVCVDVFKEIKNKYPQAKLQIIGQKPPERILENEGIEYLGFLNKNNPQDLRIFQKALSESFMLIHPTTMDTMGAVLIEAGYHGCPSIAPRSFGIPELVKHNETGIIVNVPFTSHDFVSEILDLIEDNDKYIRMRAATWSYTREQLTWNKIGVLLKDAIQ